MSKSRLALPLSLALFAVTAAADAPSYVESRDYERINPPQTTQSDDGRIEVVEVFWYGCPHCYDFEPYIERWLESRPADVDFRRVPGVFRGTWVVHAKAYYAAEQLGVLDRIHSPLFKAMHEQRRALNDEEAMAAFFVEQGVPRAQFDKAWQSFSVESKVRQAMALTRGYGISGVPSVIVNGKYRSSASLAGGFDQVLKVVDFLVDKEREEPATPH